MVRGRPPTEQLLAHVDSEVGVLRDRFGGLPHSLEFDHVLREIWLLETHHSTAIEGSSLSVQDVVAVVERRNRNASSPPISDIPLTLVRKTRSRGTSASHLPQQQSGSGVKLTTAPAQLSGTAGQTFTEMEPSHKPDATSAARACATAITSGARHPPGRKRARMAPMPPTTKTPPKINDTGLTEAAVAAHNLGPILYQRLFDGQHITPTNIERTGNAFLTAIST